MVCPKGIGAGRLGAPSRTAAIAQAFPDTTWT
jgi:hypothetical protein